jgi:hypothetical protein
MIPQVSACWTRYAMTSGRGPVTKHGLGMAATVWRHVKTWFVFYVLASLFISSRRVFVSLCLEKAGLEEDRFCW